MLYIWIGIILLLSLLEMVSTKTIWFILSAFVSLLLSFFFSSFFIQFLVFIIGGIFLWEEFHDTILEMEEKVFHKIFVKKQTKSKYKKQAKRRKK